MRKFKIPIQIKFLILIAILLSLISLLTIKFVGDYSANSLRKEIGLRARMFGKSIAASAEDALIENDELFLFKLVTDAVKNRDILYAFVVNEEGTIKAHSDINQYGKKYTPRGKEVKAGRILKFKGKEILEITIPVLLAGKKKIGEVHLGVSLEPIKENLKKLRETIIFITLGIFFVGIVITAFMTKIMTDPIKTLVKGTMEIAEGNFDFRIRKYPKDEIGDLAVAFNQMARSLKEKELIKDAFKRYVSKQVAEEIFKNPEKYIQSLKGERRKVAVFFADIRGFTPLAEKLPPEEVVSILNDYLSLMTEIVFKYEGTLDKFIGDCIMSVFGAPISHPDDALRAVKAAYEIQEYLNRVNEERKKEGKIPVYVGIGINYGEAVVGNIGSKERLDYTVIGDTVNLASRLESLAKKGEILISEQVYNEVKEHVVVEEIPPTKVKGKERPVKIYSVKKVAY